MTTPHNPIFAAKFLRPKLGKHVIERPEIIGRISEAALFPLTIVRAGAGYGKTTLLNQAFDDRLAKSLWINCSDEDGNPQTFLLHIVHALVQRFPTIGESALQLLIWDERQGAADPAAAFGELAVELERKLPHNVFIVLDDYQLIDNQAKVHRLLEQFVGQLGEKVHVIISSREKAPLAGLAMMRAKGMVLDIAEEELAFKQAEISRLFQTQYALPLDEKMAGILSVKTEGWIMALHMLGQLMRKGCSWNSALDSLPQSMMDLFEYLLAGYLADQTEETRIFLRQTAFLDLMQGEDCDQIFDRTGSADLLRGFETKGLFTFCIGEGMYRYHHLFRDYLRRTAGFSAAALCAMHHRAAEHYRRKNDRRQTVEHLLAGKFFAEAVELMIELTTEWMTTGRQGELQRWLDQLPTDIVVAVPELMLCRGDMHRLAGDFAVAQKCYAVAEKGFNAANNATGRYQVAKAYALIYLDTVQPVLAEQHLVVALDLVDDSGAQEKARLYQMMAENMVNLGRAEEAADLFQQANELFLEVSRGDVEARMHLRTGRLYTAKTLLLRQSELRTPFQLPRSHRETPLLLSLINAFMGEVDEASSNAQEGLNIGLRMKALFVQSVAYMRLGHTKQLKSWSDREEALECYQQALDIVSSLGVERGKAEPLFGLCLLYGHQGSLDIALRYGMEGLRVSNQAKDDWMAAMIELAITVAYYKAAAYDQSKEWADRSLQSFVRCGDSYLSTVAMFWQAMTATTTGAQADLRRVGEILLTLTQANDLDFLFTRSTLLGLRDPQEVMPLLMQAARAGICHSYVTSLLADLGSASDLDRHPGYTLRVQTLGQFRVWRGFEEIRAKEWQREKAKRLLQYFITCRKQLIHKEQLVEALWGEDGSDGDFKVAMNALINALEPSRARANSFYILKQNSSYGLNLATGILLDVDEFESYVARGSRVVAKDPEQAIRLYRLALNHYKGDFLPECCYEDWCQEERERLLMLYITTAERMAHMLFDQGEIEECTTLCMRILGKDCCWEEAYRLLMKCYYRQNNRAMVIRVFRQCRDNLKAELAAAPAKETLELYRKLAADEENI